MYLTIFTRPDISFSVAFLARQVYFPAEQHLRFAKRIICYVTGTESYGLLYSYSSPIFPALVCASADADWGECKKTRNSTSC